MEFATPLIPGTLIKRYKRFLADVTLDDGSVITAHTPNTGSMRGCCEPGSRVWLRDTQNPDRKYPLSWELVEVASAESVGTLVGINTHLSNQLVEEAIENKVITELAGYATRRREVKYGAEKSRIDLLLEDTHKPDCYVEVKNVTLVEKGIAYFPDAVSTRGTKHLRELMAMHEAGYRAVLVFCLQRNDAKRIRPADDIDPEYGNTLRLAHKAGVEILAYSAEPSPLGIQLTYPVALELTK